jgi:hypothetical protein
MCAKAQVVCIDATHQGMGSGRMAADGGSLPRFYRSACQRAGILASCHPGLVARELALVTPEEPRYDLTPLLCLAIAVRPFTSAHQQLLYSRSLLLCLAAAVRPFLLCLAIAVSLLSSPLTLSMMWGEVWSVECYGSLNAIAMLLDAPTEGLSLIILHDGGESFACSGSGWSTQVLLQLCSGRQHIIRWHHAVVAGKLEVSLGTPILRAVRPCMAALSPARQHRSTAIASQWR